MNFFLNGGLKINKIKRQVIWEHWLDPFDDIKEKSSEDDTDKNQWKDSFQKSEDNQKVVVGPMLVGPMGIIPIREGCKPSELYNFWMLHTNFNIGKEVKDILNKVDGVESLDIFTRYRARLSFGKAFNEQEIKLNIEEELCKEEPPPIEVEDLLKDKLNTKQYYDLITVSRN